MPEAIINIIDGVSAPHSSSAIRKAFAECATGRYLLKLEKRDKRTNDQNAYLHTIFPLIRNGLQDIGYREVKTADDAKWVCKSLFLSYEIENGTGGKIRMVKRTRDLTKDEMSAFIEEVIQWAAEYLGVVIEPPLTQTQIKF